LLPFLKFSKSNILFALFGFLFPRHWLDSTSLIFSKSFLNFLLNFSNNFKLFIFFLKLIKYKVIYSSSLKQLISFTNLYVKTNIFKTKIENYFSNFYFSSFWDFNKNIKMLWYIIKVNLLFKWIW
jgi:hypothetical protein